MSLNWGQINAPLWAEAGMLGGIAVVVAGAETMRESGRLLLPLLGVVTLALSAVGLAIPVGVYQRVGTPPDGPIVQWLRPLAHAIAASAFTAHLLLLPNRAPRRVLAMVVAAGLAFLSALFALGVPHTDDPEQPAVIQHRLSWMLPYLAGAALLLVHIVLNWWPPAPEAPLGDRVYLNIGFAVVYAMYVLSPELTGAVVTILGNNTMFCVADVVVFAGPLLWWAFVRKRKRRVAMDVKV